MKKSTLLLIVLVALLIATPAFAREHEPTGEPISLRCTNPDDSYCTGTQDYAANTAFYVGHGWLDMYPRLHPGHLKFELEVDGVYVQPTYVEFSADPDPESDGWFLDRTYFFNFPNGMTGTHTFEGHWILPCMFVLPDCETPNADADWVHSEWVITFY